MSQQLCCKRMMPSLARLPFQRLQQRISLRTCQQRLGAKSICGRLPGVKRQGADVPWLVPFQANL